MFCQYRDALGKPNQGVHKHYLGIAVFDLVATIILGYLIWKFTGVNPWVLAVVIAIITVLVHRLFCVNTTVNKAIFGEV